MEEVVKKQYCDQCHKDTVHVLREDALEIESVCNECNKEEHVIKNFF